MPQQPFRRQLAVIGELSDHLELHGLKADELAREHDSNAARMSYVKTFFQDHVWKAGAANSHFAGPGRINDA